MSKEKPHPKNVPGASYVVDGCCTPCGVFDALAPALFAFDVNDHCYVRLQPRNETEMEAALRVVRTQELGCVRYRGTDPVILRRLAEAGEISQCDAALPDRISPMLRNHVTFSVNNADEVALSGAQVLQDFGDYLLHRSHTARFRVTPVVEGVNQARVSISWYEDHFHDISIRSVTDRGSAWLIHHSFNLGVSELIDDWLKQSARFGDVRCRSNGTERGLGKIGRGSPTWACSGAREPAFAVTECYVVRPLTLTLGRASLV